MLYRRVDLFILANFNEYEFNSMIWFNEKKVSKYQSRFYWFDAQIDCKNCVTRNYFLNVQVILTMMIIYEASETMSKAKSESEISHFHDFRLFFEVSTFEIRVATTLLQSSVTDDMLSARPCCDFIHIVSQWHKSWVIHQFNREEALQLAKTIEQLQQQIMTVSK
jgi:hypothetical protein